MPKPLYKEDLEERLKKINQVIKDANDPNRFNKRINNIDPSVKQTINSILNLEIDDADEIVPENK